MIVVGDRDYLDMVGNKTENGAIVNIDSKTIKPERWGYKFFSIQAWMVGVLGQ